MVAQTRGANQSSPHKLKFRDKLVGKGLSTDALLKKLKGLQQELKDMDQAHVDVSSLHVVRKELIHSTIFLHRDQGVKAYAACCLADILRLYAPDAPYTQNELRDIFQFFFQQLEKYLKGQDSPYYDQYFHLLDSLSTVKSVVLVCDLPEADDLIVTVFRHFFAIVRRDLPQNLRMHMADILVALTDESTTVPSGVIEILMAQFTDKNARSDQPAYQMAVNVCNATADKLQRHVCQYFTDIITARPTEEDEEADYTEIEAAHALVKRLNRSCPALLHNVVPQLEEEMRVADIKLRVMATQVLGEMFAEKRGADLMRKYPTTWAAWLGRHKDKSSTVRQVFVEATKGLIQNLPESRESLEEVLASKLYDPDDKVRTAVCKIYGQLDYETALHHVSENQLRTVVGRGLDKKHPVRLAASTTAGKLWILAYPEMYVSLPDNGDPAAIRHFSWIPQAVCDMFANTDARSAAENALSEYIFPLPTASANEKGKDAGIDEGVWTDKLLTTMRFLDDKGIKSMINFTGIKHSRPTVYEGFLQACIENNGGVIDEDEEKVVKKLANIIKRISGTFPDTQKAADDLHTFAKLNEGRLYKHLKACMDPQTDLKGLVKATTEFIKRLEQSSAAIVPTMKIVLRRASLRVINQSLIPTLIKRVQKGDPSGDGHGTSQAQLNANNAHALLTIISKYLPALYKPHVNELAKGLAEDKNPRMVEVCLQALASVAKGDPNLAPSYKKTAERVQRYALSSNKRHSKFAARLLAISKNAAQSCQQVVDNIADSLPEAVDEQLVAYVAVLQQLAHMAPDAFEQKSDVIIAHLLKEVLMAPCPLDEDAMEDDAEWMEDSQLPPQLQAKLLSMKLCRNRCLAHASSDNALEIATPVLKMFITVISNGGSFTAESDDKSAAISLLRLCTVQKFAEAMSRHFVTLAVMVQDPCFQVRISFLTKLIILLSPRKLPPYFNTIPFLTVHDPDPEVIQSAKAFVAFASRTWPPSIRSTDLELLFLRFLHLLAHHPDFGTDHEQLLEMAKYLDFYIELVATEENISLLHHLAMRCKTVRDAESDSEVGLAPNDKPSTYLCMATASVYHERVGTRVAEGQSSYAVVEHSNLSRQNQATRRYLQIPP
ncbi:hypothetical protein PUNSTDRAFT_67344 [Punctularia strigosozonata HHB-11173 SS5]|uniref:uncharacterized protein n=1 Tax=Punctularia strigosozonata (strain HHB-11173) TaxID=741275 RepID=UPI0004417846|nr:uncharacterized protein PUNSTDRAFT_67344 [Punctularia strigosozonata HHB-11173 SS5]EIN08867.1 hypothetical protein PUNSTDRAFT_67344 [Punctularia strigosozonata HHB-11173 SS5]